MKDQWDKLRAFVRTPVGAITSVVFGVLLDVLFLPVLIRSFESESVAFDIPQLLGCFIVGGGTGAVLGGCITLIRLRKR